MAPPLRIGRALAGPTPETDGAAAALPAWRGESTRAMPRPLARPLVDGDLAPVPASWRVGPPDFVGLGCGKAGTTWWWCLLEQHPQVVPNRAGEKELHHFSHFDLRGPDAAAIEVYRRAFAAPPGAISGEFTCTYLNQPLAVDWLHAAAPTARCIAMLRNPIDRAVSAYNMLETGRAKLFGLEGEAEHALLAFSLFPEAMQSSLVAGPLERAIELFGRDQVQVLQYERCQRDGAAQFRRTCEFLGIDPSFVPSDLTRPVNDRAYTIAKPDAERRRRLAAYFRHDVERLAGLCPELELGLWPDFT
ncbi:sulfotransferase [Engelhardtia mirabilis]|uniref:Sulfotransferase domain protein n=1 Tax=Engelhardtia mirabilis TaxID=2528011 RepID=A0A518BMT7_9BACT|nr:Sulfotransferase domain protein [Planctomycetes bacterium Pla133]QDV02626.1 Sulfotransferase domain protein [Planctomycetes bacterium Pla86]